MKLISSLQRLKDIGFRHVGEWKLETDKLRCVLTDCEAEVRILYAFECDGEILYIGKSVRSLSKRMYGYQNPGPSQRTNIKANEPNELIQRILGEEKIISIHAFVDTGNLKHGEFRVNLAAGLEDDLIDKLKPVWNKVGLSKSGNKRVQRISTSLEPDVIRPIS